MLRSVGFLVKCEACSYTVYKCIQHNKKHNEAEPGKKFEIAFYYNMPQVSEGFQINFFNE